MAAEDIAITVAVRRVLTSHWIDITRVRIRTTRGVVHLAGHIHRMTADHADLTERNLRELNLSLRSIKGVRTVYYDLGNWQRDGLGGWRRANTQADDNSSGVLAGPDQVLDAPTDDGPLP